VLNILEIGAAAAYASLLLRETVEGNVNLNVCEPGKNWEDYYIKHEIRKVANYFPFEAQFSFDYIHTSHWLEHVLDLNQTIPELSNMLVPNGYIFVEVPNTEHFYWDLPIEDVPHIHFFTRKSLIESFKSHGFECCNIEECGITYADGYNGVNVTPDKYGVLNKGYWIRALFKKS
jgi:SAM-dependent methyltransferase